VKFFARGAREATGTSSSSPEEEEPAAAAAVVLDATAKAEAVGVARAGDKLGLGVEVAPLYPANDHFLNPAAARHRRDSDGARRTGRRGTALHGRTDCSSRCVTVGARRRRREEGARTCV
jgi:hypothetical protein